MSDLNETAEKLAKHYAAEKANPYDLRTSPYWIPELEGLNFGALFADESKLARAFVEEMDPTPITEEWFKTAYGGYWCEGGSPFIVYVKGGTAFLQIEFDDHPESAIDIPMPHKSRGQLRQLIAALKGKG